MNFDTVKKLGLTLPGVNASSTNETVALKANGKLMACTAIHRSAEPNSLMVRVDSDDRAALIAEDPGVYYITDHYIPYDAVLVRLSRIKRDALKDLLRMAHTFVTKQAARK